MNKIAATLFGAWAAVAAAGPDPAVVGRECARQAAVSGSYDKIQECINRVLATSSSPPKAQAVAKNVTAAASTAGSSVAAPSSEGESKIGTEREGETKPSPKPFQPLDPDVDYGGQPCYYFTRQMEVSRGWDGVRTYGPGFHAEGTQLAYGKWAYRCEHGYWVNAGDMKFFSHYPTARSVEREER